MNVFEFGRALLATEDLDPVYCLLARSQLAPEVLKRWMVSYWWFYDVGTASKIAESSQFYNAARTALPHARRGAERRHFRGHAAATAIDQWELRWPDPCAAIDAWGELGTFAEYCLQSKREAQVGNWVVYKMADMTERVLRQRLIFPSDMTGWYSEPRAGATIIAKELHVATPELAVQFLLSGGDWNSLAPPHYDRNVNIQEIETICCKYKAHTKGHYAIGHDWEAIAKSLLLTPGDIASSLLKHVPEQYAFKGLF